MPTVNRTNLAAVIEVYRQYTTPRPAQLFDYQSLKSDILQLDLQEAINDLQTLVTIPDDEVLRSTFKTLCGQREKRNQGSLLSFFVNPTLYANALYWEVMQAVFNPQHLQEALAIIAPHIQGYVNIETVAQQHSTQLPPLATLDFRLSRQSLEAYAAKPASLELLSTFISQDDLLFDVGFLKKLPLVAHFKLQRALSIAFPQLAEALYEHNTGLKRLNRDLKVIQHQGQPPLQAIKYLIEALKLGGSRMNGQEENASDAASLAVSEFLDYLHEINEELCKALLSLSNGRQTLRNIVNRLKHGDCVETAAYNLTAIVENLSNHAVLNTTPKLSQQRINQLAKQYGSRNTLATFADDSYTRLPSERVQQVLKKITINKFVDYINIFLAVPESFYSNILQYADIRFYPMLNFDLAKALNDGFLNSVQKKAFIEALWDNRNKFGEIAILRFIFLISDEQISDFIFSSPSQLLYLATTTEDYLRRIPIHLRAYHHDLIFKLLTVFSEIDRIRACQIQDKGGETLLHHVLFPPRADVRNRQSNDAMLMMILKLLPQNQRLTSLQIASKYYNGTVLHALADSPDNPYRVFSELFKLLPKNEWPALFLTPDRNNHQLVIQLIANRYDAVNLPDNVLLKCIKCLPIQYRFNVITASSKNKKNALQIIVHNFLYSKWFFRNGHLTLQNLIKLLPQEQRFSALTIKDEKNQTILDQLYGHSTEALISILALLPSKHKMQYMTENSNRLNLFKIIKITLEDLKHIPKEMRLQCALIADKNQKTIFDRNRHNQRFLEILLAKYIPNSPKIPFYNDQQILIAALEGYCALRDQDARETYHWRFITYLGGGFSKSFEKEATQRLIGLIKHKPTEITAKHVRALRQGELGSIINTWERCMARSIKSFIPKEIPMPSRCCLQR